MLKLMLASLLMSVSLGDAQKALENKDYLKAADLYQQYLENVSPGDFDARYGLARSLAFAGKWEEALKAYNAILNDFPGEPDSLLGRGRLLGWMKRYSEAAADLSSLIEKKPEYHEAWSALADIYRWDHQLEAGEKHAEAWQTQFPESPAPLLALAQLHMDFRLLVKARADVAAAQKAGASPEETNRLLSQIQQQPGALPWELQGFYEFQAFVPHAGQDSRPPWNNFTLGIRHAFPQGSVALQSLTVNRFDRLDQAFVLDGYLSLWPRAFGNLRLQGALSGDILPHVDVLGEVFQEFGDSWETSLGYRQMAFSNAPVHFFQAGLGHYFGNLYLRLQPQLFLSPEGPGIQAALWARYFFDSADNFLELRLGAGRQVMLVNADTLQGQNSFFALLNGQMFITPQWGLLGTLNYNYYDQFPHMLGFTLGSKFRW